MQDKGKVKQFKDDKQGLRTDPPQNPCGAGLPDCSIFAPQALTVVAVRVPPIPKVSSNAGMF